MNHLAVGKTGEAFTLDVEAGKVREFAKAVRSSNEAYLGEAPIVPPTFFMTQTFWTRPESEMYYSLEIPPGRGLHAEQEFVFHGPPPRAGVRLNAQQVISSVDAKEGSKGTLTFGSIVTEYRDEAGNLVAEARFVAVERG
jgi:hypothetical protein